MEAQISHRVQFVCKHVCPHFFPADLWFWSIYQEEQHCNVILCVNCVYMCMCFMFRVWNLHKCVCVLQYLFSLNMSMCIHHNLVASVNVHACMCFYLCTYALVSICKFRWRTICVCVCWGADEWMTAAVSSVAQGAAACGGSLVCLPLLLKQWFPMGPLST